jgi:dipeptidyl aminopeptidase/acylaminoacyl peptidase
VFERIFPNIDGHLVRGVDRFVRWGLSTNVAGRILSKVESGEAPFVEAWTGEGRRWEELSQERAEHGHGASAKAYARQGFFSYRIADFALTANTPEKLDAYDGTLRCFAAAGADQVEPIEVSVDGSTLVGYVAGQSLPKDSPGVVFIYGADGNKEEHIWASVAALVGRGCRVLVIDGPGQGQAVRRDGIAARPDYEVVASACVDVLLEMAPVDSNRLAIAGSSLGGYYAPRAFALEPRFRACAVNSGLFSVADGVWDFYPPVRSQLQYNLLAESEEEARAKYEDFSLEPIRSHASQDDRPLLVYHGSDDIYIPVDQAQKVADTFGSGASVKIWPGVTHNMANASEEAVPQLWDWLVEQL